jgi:protease-4
VSDGSLSTFGQFVAVAAIVGLVVGAIAAPAVWAQTRESESTVAVVEMHGTITGDTATAVVDNLREARRSDSVEAVVLDINSPGGTAAASEQLYLAVKRTQQEIPVVTSVTGLAASGGYYMAAPSDRIYVTPASTVGSVGVRATVPPDGIPAGQVITGPDKGSTATDAEVRRRVEALRRAFVGSVLDERAESLTLDAAELSYAKVYSGATGVELGLADEVGGLDAAIQDAANRADLGGYEVVRMESPQPSTLSQLGLNSTASGPTARQSTFDYRSVDTVQYLMLHGRLERPTTGVNTSAGR